MVFRDHERSCRVLGAINWFTNLLAGCEALTVPEP
jgi:hypothetical protein